MGRGRAWKQDTPPFFRVSVRGGWVDSVHRGRAWCPLLLAAWVSGVTGPSCEDARGQRSQCRIDVQNFLIVWWRWDQWEMGTCPGEAFSSNGERWFRHTGTVEDCFPSSLPLRRTKRKGLVEGDGKAPRAKSTLQALCPSLREAAQGLGRELDPK